MAIQLNDLKSELISINPGIVSYFTTYPAFIEYFATIDRISKQELLIGISFTYSWMPTILKNIDARCIDDALCSVNKVNQNRDLSEIEVEKLTKCTNNSLVGASKLIHFVSPERYAIWDSKVCQFYSIP